jgi:malonyl CoA-acyl carrier protein transacylase/pimeloyl-ACP methyl ester carboxylesterase/acyl carrier protein
LVIPTENKEWRKRENRKRIAGVSGFAFQGTNAHVIIEEAELNTYHNDRVNNSPVNILKISAKSKGAIQDYARRYKLLIEGQLFEKPELFNILCSESNRYRSDFTHRLSIVANDYQSLINGLDVFLSNTGAGKYYYQENYSVNMPEIAMIFSGQGFDRFEYLKEIYDLLPHYRSMLDTCAKLIMEISGIDIIKYMFYENTGDHTQLAIFVHEIALAKSLMAGGVKPNYVLGHSLGEICAAVIAEIISFEDGARLILLREDLMNMLDSKGEMLAVSLSINDLKTILAENNLNENIDVAAINHSQQVVLSGDKEYISKISDVFKIRHVECIKLDVANAFHSRLMQPILEKFRMLAKSICYHKPKIIYVSSVDSKILSDSEFNAEYLCKNIVSTVNFEKAIEVLYNAGNQIFLEISPKEALKSSISINLQQLDRASTIKSKLNHKTISVISKHNLVISIYNCIAELYSVGINIDWFWLYGFGASMEKINLPTYPFQRRVYWPNNSSNEVVMSNDMQNPTTSILKELDNRNDYIDFDINLEIDTEHYNKFVDKICNEFKEMIQFPEKIHPDMQLLELGIDSVYATKILKSLNDKFNVNIPPTILFEFQCVKDFAQYLYRTHRNSVDRYMNEIPNRVSDSHYNSSIAPQLSETTKLDIQDMWDAIDEKQKFDFPVELMQIKDRKGRIIEFALSGNGKIPVVLLSGRMLPYRDWYYQFESLKEQYKLIIPHTPGVFASQVPQEGLTLQSIVEDIIFIIEYLQLQNKVNLVGHSFGGILAQELYHYKPLIINSLTLANTIVNFSGTEFNPKHLQEEVVKSEHLLDLFASVPVELSVKYTEIVQSFDSRNYAHQIQVPILVISGEVDKYTPHNLMADILLNAPDVEHHIIKGAGHMTKHTHYNMFNSILVNFLSKIRGEND